MKCLPQRTGCPPPDVQVAAKQPYLDAPEDIPPGVIAQRIPLGICNEGRLAVDIRTMISTAAENRDAR